jgi:diguanylate cyclase (GGDEF)-like protein/PAS domain S-box-containing protein
VAALLVSLAGPPGPYRSLEFIALMAVAILASAFMKNTTSVEDPTVTPSFVIDFASLLLVGPGATMLVSTAGALARGLAHSPHAPSVRQVLVTAATSNVAIQAAGLAYQTLGGTLGDFVWPWQVLPLAAAVIGYCVAQTLVAELIAPLTRKQSIDPLWVQRSLQRCTGYVIGAAISIGCVEVIHDGPWALVLVVGLPLYLGYRAHLAHLEHVECERRRREVLECVDEGLCVIDGAGAVTLWGDALERLLGCSRQGILGCRLADALPALDKTELPKTIGEVLTDRVPRTVARVALRSLGEERTMQVKVIPVVNGAALLWNDVTERVRAEFVLKRQGERLALAAEGANDGMWEWDLRTHEFYSSRRWKEMIGVSGSAGIGRPGEWFERVHPDDIAALKEAVDAHVAGKTDHVSHEHRIRHEDGTYRRFLCRAVAAQGPQGRATRLAGSLTDTTAQARVQERIRVAGFVDPLTGLCNRAMFVEGLARRLDDLKQRRVSGRFAVLYLDLDRFKIVNDSLGHLVGDELLVGVSRRLESCLRQGDAVARLGGDEFAILLNGLSDEGQANVVAFRIQESLNAPFSIAGREVFTSVSIGIAFGQAQYESPDEIMRDADTAMYHAKARGKARHELFDADMHARTRDRLGLENDLRHAVSGNDFEVFYQPIVSLATGMCIGFESLVRWTRNGVGVSPATFIPIAEELGLIEPLGTWVLQQACDTFADWQRRFPAAGLDCITVNVSTRQLMQHNFVRIVERAVRKAGLMPCDLRIEITETALMDSPGIAAQVLRDLRDFGVKIYLDDFGTGYSSLSHLHKLPVDALKIDRSFVRSLLLPDRPAIVESILALARTLNTSVVAEGIENEVQARELERLGCTHAQGFLFSRPLSTQAAEQLVADHKPLGPKAVETASQGSSSRPAVRVLTPS